MIFLTWRPGTDKIEFLSLNIKWERKPVKIAHKSKQDEQKSKKAARLLSNVQKADKSKTKENGQYKYWDGVKGLK